MAVQRACSHVSMPPNSYFGFPITFSDQSHACKQSQCMPSLKKSSFDKALMALLLLSPPSLPDLQHMGERHLGKKDPCQAGMGLHPDLLSPAGSYPDTYLSSHFHLSVQ